MKFSDFIESLYPAPVDGQRWGQHVMNRLHDFDRDAYIAVVTEVPDVDPFHIDARVPALFAYLFDRWA